MSEPGEMNQVWQGVSRSVQATMAIGRELATCLRAGDVLALDGELGAGKTQLVRGLAEGLGVKTANVASPTFVMVHEYQPDPAAQRDENKGIVLVHIDAYRLRSLDELETLGWSSHETDAGDTLAELRNGAVVVIEWAEKVRSALGDDVLSIRLQHVGEHERQIEIVAGRGWNQRVMMMRQVLEKVDQQQHRPVQRDTGETVSEHRCPICKASTAVTGEFFPFCSKRCRMVDLGKWLGGDYRISRPAEQSDLEEGVD